LIVNFAIEFKITDGYLVDFDPTMIPPVQTTIFSQDIGAIIEIPDGTLNQQISLQGIQNIQMLYFFADQAVGLKIIPSGGLLANAHDFILLPNFPSLISASNIQQLYVSNNSGQISKLTIKGCG
jgi:hypothetical protein